jgi:hypothetical protein
MLLRDSTNPGTNVDRKILDKAINATVQEFKPMGKSTHELENT